MKRNFNSQKVLREAMVTVSDVQSNYPNIVFNERTKEDELNKALLDDIQKAAEANDFKITVDYAKKGHGKYTKSGHISRHWKGSAVDIDFIYVDGDKKVVSPKNKEVVEKFTDTLISMGYNKNAEGTSNPKSVLTFGFADHDDHVHVSNTSDSSFEGEIDTKSGDKENKPEEESIFKDMTQKEKDKIYTDFLTSIVAEGKGDRKKIISETIRIKNLMK